VNSFFPLSGSVYVLENCVAQRVKVGMTGIGLNDVADRLRDVNDMWAERKVTCQICGGRFMNVRDLVPRHVKSGRACTGGNELPIEKSTALAARRLQELKDSLTKLRGIGLGSAVRMASTLEQRIEKYRAHIKPAGAWKFGVSVYTERVVEVESLAHKRLAEHLDRRAPFGEVFRCTTSEATEAVEAALSQLGLLGSAEWRTVLQDPRGWNQRPLLYGDAFHREDVAQAGHPLRRTLG
jgi:hypothetical protein